MKKTFFFTLLLLGVTVSCRAATLYDTVKKGSDLYGQEKYDEALNAFVDGQIENPEDARLKFNIASAKYRMKNYEEALNGFLDVAATARDARLEEKALYNAGNALYRQGKLEQAVEYYKKALELDPNDKEAQQNLEYVREEIKRRMNEAKKTQEQQQQQEQKQNQQCQNPQKQPDNQTAQNQNEQQKQDQQKDQAGQQQEQPKQEQQSADQQQKDQQQAQQQQAAAAGEKKDEKADEKQAQAQDSRDITKDQAEQYLNSVQENRTNQKEGKQAARSQGGSRSGKDW